MFLWSVTGSRAVKEMDQESIKQEWTQASAEISTLYNEEEQGIRENVQLTAEASRGLATELENLKAEHVESQKELDSEEVTLVRSYSSIAVGALGFVGSCYITAWVLRAMLPAEFAAKVDVLTEAARAFQAALTNLHLREAAFCLGLLVLAALITLKLTREGMSKSWKRDLVIVIPAAFITLVPYYSFGNTNSVGLLEGAFVSCALVSPLFGLLRMSRIRSIIDATLQLKYANLMLISLVVLGVLALAFQWYPILLAIILFASVFFYEMIVVGASMQRRLLRHEALLKRMGEIELELRRLEEERSRFRANLQELPRRRRADLDEIREQYQRRLVESTREQRWQKLIDRGKKP